MQKVAEGIYIRNLKVGSYQAFNAIYGIYSNRLYGYCYRYTKSHEDAQDIVQEVFTAQGEFSVDAPSRLTKYLSATEHE